MSSIFCCSSVQPYKNKRLSHESKFTAFMAQPSDAARPASSSYAVQVVKQVNFGPLESKRYFTANDSVSGEDGFVEVAEQWLIDGNFQKLNTFKNFKCSAHNEFFEVNVYQKDPLNSHHWRSDVARPASQIDL
ncbi:hypothetical protein BU26DRAFT_537916 [Trematosphaeria pertusa]|uniref:Uncharacterized protein n=1 Tax=Trematosphaeria pertusa TaxID=390896 RepID=A0A6A6ISV7_9PLEO|nr:uncharacterized protein BU26DRAFT_537916 [Trematosphaeria pertusa]KAF2252912.1 hypothetical protein BU26DRAFT_537916 [Trematosphaeria pertusa]